MTQYFLHKGSPQAQARTIKKFFSLLSRNAFTAEAQRALSLRRGNMVLFFLLLSALTSYAADIIVSDLRCNYTVNPIGIDNLNPLLSWKLKSALRDQRQTSYQLIVGESAQVSETSALWNSGKVNSSQSVHVRYEGPALKYGVRYYWKVKVWDTKDAGSNFSDAAFFETTIDPSGWKAEWISAPVIFDLQKLNDHRYSMIHGRTKNDYLEPLPLLRKKFSADKKVKKATVYISGLGFHELYINGTKVSDHILAPAFTNYDKTVLYNVHDVTALVANGDNAIGVMMGNGWYNSASKEVWGFDTAPWRNYPALKFQMEIIYDDNTTQTIVSDPTWKAATGAVAFSQVRQGEYYDARLETAGWSNATLDDKMWQPVRKVAGPMGVLQPQAMPPVKEMKNFKAIGSKKLANGNVVYDFGQNIAGFIHIKVKGKPGTRLQFLYSEKIDQNGAADQSGINNLLSDSLFQVDRYTLVGNREEVWSPRFVYHGFRYAELSIKGEAPQQLEVSANAVHTSFEQQSEFSCSNDLINKIHQSTLWSYKNNFIGFPTDCPQREKNGWTGDAQLACETGLTNFNTVTSYKKWLGDLRDEQQPNGSLPGIVPTSGWGYYWGNGPAWDIACVVVPWSLYLYTGDKSILEENYSMMKKYVDYMHSRSPEYITDFGLGDWIPVETETPVAVTSTGYFHYGALVLSKSAAALGKHEDQKAYEQLSLKISEAFHKKFFDENSLTYSNGSQTALSCALFHGFVPDRYKNQVGRKLVDVVHAKNDHIDTGILGARYIFHALDDLGQTSLAYKMISTKTFPGWGYWIDQGATTLWEDWKGESSRNHIMLGDVSSWFYKALAGIQLDEAHPGFSEFVIKPAIVGDLKWAKGKYESVYGMIVSNWRIDGNKVIHEIEVPVNTSAVYVLPGALQSASESGRAMKISSIKINKDKEGKESVVLGSGRYTFTSSLQ